MTSDEIRTSFLEFFRQKGHDIIPSSSLIPRGDPTLLLTTAGMVQFKPYFLGQATPPNRRLASCQKCFRTTDIESVGDPSHLTFFEMLGNFSIGDYFKREAIDWAWEYMTGLLKLPPEKLWITIYLDDDEAFGYWRDIGVPEERILRFGEETNFWGPAGNSGPCGPCSEIHYDFGPEVGCGRPACAPNCGCPRFSEVWNLVFTQYDQDETGKRTPLPRPNIDTGMGLERIAAAVSGKTTVYETDLFAPSLELLSVLSGKKYGDSAEADNAMRVVAEHGRAVTFLIADGVLPGNEGRGYVLRRLLRRAQYFSESLTHDRPLLVEVAKSTIARMKHVYPEVGQRRDFILEVIQSEVSKFQEALLVGRGLLDQVIVRMRRELAECFSGFERSLEEAWTITDYPALRHRLNDSIERFLRDCPAWWHVLSVGGRDAVDEVLRPLRADLEALKTLVSDGRLRDSASLRGNLEATLESVKEKVEATATLLSGYEAFILHDTYGFPAELTREIASRAGFSVDMAGFDREMERQRERARAAHKFEGAVAGERLDVEETRFVGYHALEQSGIILKLLVDGRQVEKVEKGQKAGLVLSETPFYGEMGGQAGDAGEIRGPGGRFIVTDAVRPTPDIIVHQGYMAEGVLTAGETVQAAVDRERRSDIARNHTATHLLQWALRRVLGEHVQQRGSLVAPDRLRFDFSHLTPLTGEQIAQVQQAVNEVIRHDLPVYSEETSYAGAVEEGAIALFGEKYGEVVRVMKVGRPPVSAELCGGTHVTATGEIGLCLITGESSVGAGLRRIEAVTGRQAERLVSERLADLDRMAQALETSAGAAPEKLSALLEVLDSERSQRLALEKELGRITADRLLDSVETVKDVNLIAARVPPARVETLREMIDYLRERLKSGIIVLGSVYEDRPVFVAAVTSDLVAKGYSAGEIVRQAAKAAGGGGGGKASFAQAGGKHKEKLDEALALVKSLV